MGVARLVEAVTRRMMHVPWPQSPEDVSHVNRLGKARLCHMIGRTSRNLISLYNFTAALCTGMHF